jgi:hypothetical protein
MIRSPREFVVQAKGEFQGNAFRSTILRASREKRSSSVLFHGPEVNPEMSAADFEVHPVSG